MIDKYARDGAKKILSLTKTKIRLARESDTVECIPAPLPLVRYLSGREIKTIDEADTYRETLLKEIDYSSERSVASTVLMCMDIIEGVKHRYEPEEYCSSLTVQQMESFEGKKVNISLMTESVNPNVINLFFGEKPAPEGSIYVSGVQTSLASFLSYAFSSKHFSSEGKLRNISAGIGRRTLINNAIYFSLGVYGADLSSGAKYLDCDGVH